MRNNSITARNLKTYLICVFLFIHIAGFTQRFTISGYVSDAGNGETLIGATAKVKGTAQGTVTDLNGFYQLSGLETGKYVLEYSYLGYEKMIREITIEDKSLILSEVRLRPSPIDLDEVSVFEVKGEQVGDRSIETSQLQLSSKVIQSIPTAGNDVFKAIKYLPGIEGTEPFSPLYSARGGDPGENRVMLDGITIYNPYHYSTSAGIFNVQTLKSVDLFTGGYGAEFGGSNSSIMYLITKDGNNSELTGEVEPTLMHTKAVFEFPVGEKSTMMMAGRYFYDLPSYFLLYTKSYFYDLNLSWSMKINNRNRINVKVFQSKDHDNFEFNQFLGYLSSSFGLDIYDDFNMSLNNNWNNFAGTFIYKSIFSPRLFFRSQVYYSGHSSDNFSGLDFTYEVEEDFGQTSNVKLFYNTQFKAAIRDLGMKNAFTYKWHAFNETRIGLDYNLYEFTNSASINNFDKGEELRAPGLMAAYVENKSTFGPVILRPGLRISKYGYDPDVYLEPRVNFMVHINNGLRLKGAFGQYYQYIISMNTQEYELSQFLDYYYPLRNFSPSKSVHYILGLEKDLFNTTSLAVDLYYKDIRQTYMFDLNQSEFEAYTFSDKIQSGTGEAYGMELFWKGNWNRFSGWISYTLSRSTRSYPNIMNSNSFLFDYDRTHSLNMLVNFEPTSRINYSTSLVLLTGNPRSIESTLQEYFYYDALNDQVASYPMFIVDRKNNARLPAVIEWDVGLKKKIRKGFGKDLADFINADESYLTVTIGNLLFLRRNVLWYFPLGFDDYLPIGANYFPYVNTGFSIKF